MTILDNKSLNFIDYVAMPFLVKIKNYYAALIIESREDDNRLKARISIIDIDDSGKVGIMLDSATMDMNMDLEYFGTALAGTGDESVMFFGPEQMIATFDATSHSSVKVSQYLVCDFEELD